MRAERYGDSFVVQYQFARVEGAQDDPRAWRIGASARISTTCATAGFGKSANDRTSSCDALRISLRVGTGSAALAAAVKMKRTIGNIERKDFMFGNPNLDGLNRLFMTCSRTIQIPGRKDR